MQSYLRRTRTGEGIEEPQRIERAGRLCEFDIYDGSWRNVGEKRDNSR